MKGKNLNPTQAPETPYLIGRALPEYKVTSEADRVGYRLQGEVIKHKAGADIISDGVPLGAVQVPGDGLPIVLLADRQTTGGYPKIATVITVAIPALAQMKPGDKIRFTRTSESEARKLIYEYEERLSALRSYLAKG